MPVNLQGESIQVKADRRRMTQHEKNVLIAHADNGDPDQPAQPAGSDLIKLFSCSIQLSM